jgi:conjugative transposon TraN protein
MKFLIIVVILLTAGGFVRAQVNPSFALTAMTAQKIPVTDHKMTNLVFPVQIRTGIKVSKDVLVQKVKGIDNVIELKAARPRFAPTNLSVFGVDGRLYSFDLEYAENPTALTFIVVNDSNVRNSAASAFPSPVELTGLPVNENELEADAISFLGKKAFLHRSTYNEMMRLQLRGTYCKDSLLWLVLQLRNHSLIAYRTEYLRLYIVDRKQVKRMAVQQVPIDPVWEKLPSSVDRKAAFAVGLPLFTLAKDKKLILELAERGGGRVLMLPIGYKALLMARNEGHVNKQDTTAATP